MADQNGTTETSHSSTSRSQAEQYSDAFPGMPTANAAAGPKKVASLRAKNSMSLIGRRTAAKKSSEITKTVTIPRSERRMGSNHVGLQEMKSNCGQVSKQTGTRISYSINKDESIHVIIQGKNEDSVNQAQNLIKNRLAEQGMVEVQIAKQFHRFILGRQGVKLRDLEEKSGTKIRIPGPSDESDKIKISGPKDGIEMARKEIVKIAKNQGERGNEKLDIPREYHAFIRGRKEEIASQCSGHVMINVPPTHKPDSGTELSIIGDKQSVNVAKLLIQDIYNRKKEKVTEVSVDIAKEQHRYIIGKGGAGVQEIFTRHDVVVEVPPTESKSLAITLRGEPQHLGPALNEVYALATSYCTKTLTAPKWCRPKIVGPKGATIKEFNAKFPKVRIDIKDQEEKIDLSGPIEEVERAEVELGKFIKTILTNFTVKTIKVPQEHHGRIIGAKGANLKAFQQKYDNLNIRLPGKDDKGDQNANEIRIEGSPEDVAEVHNELKEMAAKFANEASEMVEFEQKYHKFFFQRTDFNNPNSKDKISLIRAKFPETLTIQFPDRNSSSNEIRVRGPRQLVVAAIKEMKILYQEIVAQNYTGSVLIMKQFHKNIIGKAGANIKQLKDEFNVQIDIPDSGSDSQLIKITGPKPQVEKARQRLRKMESDHANITEVTVPIAQKLHSQLIGKKGAQINDVRQKYQVLIQFPERDEKSDAVIIRGTEDSVAGAKAELSQLAAIKLEEGYTESVECPAEHIKFMIGKGGSTKDKLQAEHSVTLIMPNRDSKDTAITVLGKQANVKKARVAIEKRLEILKQTKETDIQVPKKYHVNFLRRGKNGNILAMLQENYAGTQIKVPAQGSNDEVFIINGPSECVEDVKDEIRKYVEKFENTSSIEVELPCKNEDIRSLIGTGGANINPIQDKYNVEIKIDRAAEGEDAQDRTCKAHITGHKDQLNAARDDLLALCPETIEYNMPSEYHGILLGKQGVGIRELCEQLQITIKVPKRNDDSEAQNTITLKGTATKLDNAIIVLDERRGQYHAEAEERYLQSYQLELEVPSHFHSKLIGVKGENITKLRDEFKVNVQMPDRRENGSRNNGDRNDVIKIIGFQENAEQAAKAIQEFCDNLMQTVEKEVEIENSVHRRIIGQRGRGVRKLMQTHTVDIKFPRTNDPQYEERKDIVSVSGMPSNVDAAIEALTALEEEFMQELGVDEVYDNRYKPMVAGQEAVREHEAREQRNNHRGGGQRRNQPMQQFANAPWNQAGDSTEQAFPTIGSGNQQGNNAQMGDWARMRR